MNTIAENVKECRDILAVEITKLHDSKKKSAHRLKNKLSPIFNWLSEILQNNKTDEELVKKIDEKIDSNEELILTYYQLLMQKNPYSFANVVYQINHENRLYRALRVIENENYEQLQA
jgi:hypothetical protein